MLTENLRAALDTAQLGVRLLRLMAGPTSAGVQRRGDRPRLALLAWALPPSTNAGVHRPLSWLRYGGPLGWDITAFGGEVPPNQRAHGDELRATVPASVPLHAVPRPPQTPFHRLFPRVDGGFKNAIAFAEAAIAALRDTPPDVVLASGPPFHTFVSARLVARHFGVPYVLDYRDEWSECPFEFVSNQGNDRWWETWCLRRAAAVTFTTESHRRHQLSRFPVLDAQRTALIPNGWEPADFEGRDADPPAAPQPAGLLLSHVGTLSDHTPIEPLLTLLAGLRAAPGGAPHGLRVRLVGRRSAAVDAVIARHADAGPLECVGPVGKREANREMAAGSVLLLIAAPGLERYLPGKLFDYVAARRPILVLGTRGESSALIEHLGIGVHCAGHGPDDLRRALEAAGRVDMQRNRATVDAWLARHERQALAAQMFEQLDRLVRPAA